MADPAFIQDVPTRDQYVAAAAQTIFDYTFPIFDQADLVVQQTLVSSDLTGTLVVDVDYTVTGVEAQNGGTVVLTIGAAAGDEITIDREVEKKRITDFTKAGQFRAEVVNREFDRIVQMTQDRAREIQACLKQPTSDVNFPLNDLPDEASRLDKVLSFNDISGQPETYLTASLLQTLITTGLTQLTPDPTAVVASFTTARAIDGNLLVGGEVILITDVYRGGHFIVRALTAETDNDGTILELTTPNGFYLDRLFQGPYNVQWFGARPVSGFDNSAALQAVGYAITSNVAVFFPHGIYEISSAGVAVDWNNKSNIEIFGEGAQLLTPDGVTTSRPFVIRNSDKITVHHLHFKCEIPLGAAAQPCNGLDLMNVTNAHIHHNFFEGQTFYGLGVFEDNITPLDGSCAGLRVEENHFKDIGSVALEPFPKVVAGSCVIQNNTLENCGNNVTGAGTGNGIKCGQGFEDVTVKGNALINCGGVTTALAIGYYTRLIVTNNDFIKCPNINLGLSILDHALGADGTFESLIVKNNDFIADPNDVGSNGLMELSVTAAGIAIYNANKGHISVLNNSVQNTALNRAFALIRPHFDVARFTFSGNEGNNIKGSLFNSDDARGGILIDPLITKSTIRMEDTSTTIPIVCINADGGTISKNTIIGAYQYAISCGLHTGKQFITGNEFFLGNRTSIASRGPIVAGSEGGYVVFGDLHVYNNVVISSEWDALVLASVAYPLYHANNVMPKIATTSTPVENPEMTFGLHTGSGDVAVNGSVEIKDQFGVSRKLATIA